MRLSDTVIPASEDNPVGYFEDARVAVLHDQLMREWKRSPYTPRASDLLEGPAPAHLRSSLASLVVTEVAVGASTWGVKDPRICLTWPIWQRVFAEAAVIAHPVICVRDPRAVVRSLVKAYGMSRSHAEGLYLFRTLHALEDVTEDRYFVQYEQWHDRRAASSQLEGLVSFCGIADVAVDLEAVLDANVRPDLNRSSGTDADEMSAILLELHELLRCFRGEDYDDEAIVDWCAQTRTRLNDFAFVGHALEDFRRKAAPSTARRSARKARLVSRDLANRLRR